MVDQGTTPVISLSLTIVFLMVVLCVIFVIFLDCFVLRRIVNLSNVIKKQTKGHTDALKDEEETTPSTSVQEGEDPEKVGKSGKSSKSFQGTSSTSENSCVTASSETSSEATAPQRKTTRDEIENLRRAMEQNALGLRKRLEAVNESIKIEMQKNIHQKQAVQLLNLWCVRKDFFPGLRPNAVQLRYEPMRDIDDILSNPLAVEYLKDHCESDRTLENLWFILDVTWLHEVETAEDDEEDEAKRNEIHDIAAYAARTIIQRYIVANAPQQINLSASTFKKLRENGESYSRGMFDDAVGEVKLMLSTDVLPRFQKTPAYSAMSETLFIGTSGGDDESSFSDETVSTTGSILTEESEGDVPRVFVQTFKNLHTNFEVNGDGSSIVSASSSHVVAKGALPSASFVSGTVTTTSGPDEQPPSKLKEESKESGEEKESSESSDSASDESPSSSSSSSSGSD